jgi:hypothetical protein
VSDRPTPETDAEHRDITQSLGATHLGFVGLGFARDLERQRDEARLERDNARILLKTEMRSGRAADKAIADLERELQVAQTLKRELRDALSTMLDEYDDRRSQYGTDYLWQKHEDTDAISSAEKTLTKAKEVLP